MPSLLALIEIGGYPDFTPIYHEAGYHVEQFTSGRKAISALKRSPADVVVAEFNYQLHFRDRTSALESLLAVVQQHPATRTIIFVHPAEEAAFNQLTARFPVTAVLYHPITAEALRPLLSPAINPA
ncbi:MAG: hypothetical protein HQL49_08020 [Gammaproteobacteria bacterium]|nr:hypothetical protein [Gammaproteobacteria bacterium]